MKDSNLSQSACVCADEDTTTLPKKCARRSLDVVASVRIVRSHAIMDDVIDVHIVECHASMDVVIGIRVVLCHPLVLILVFSLRVQILILLSCCNNSSYFLPVVILQTFCTEEIRHFRCGTYTPVGYNRPPSAVNDPTVTKQVNSGKSCLEEVSVPITCLSGCPDQSILGTSPW